MFFLFQHGVYDRTTRTKIWSLRIRSKWFPSPQSLIQLFEPENRKTVFGNECSKSTGNFLGSTLWPNIANLFHFSKLFSALMAKFGIPYAHICCMGQCMTKTALNHLQTHEENNFQQNSCLRARKFLRKTLNGTVTRGKCG